MSEIESRFDESHVEGIESVQFPSIPPPVAGSEPSEDCGYSGVLAQHLLVGPADPENAAELVRLRKYEMAINSHEYGHGLPIREPSLTLDPTLPVYPAKDSK